MNFRERLVRGSVLIFSSSVATFLLSLAKSITVARLLNDPEAIGLLGIVASLSGIFGTAAAFGIPVAIARYVASFQADPGEASARLVRTSLAMAAILSLISGFAMFVLSPVLAVNLYNRPELTPLLQVGAGYVAASAIVAVLLGVVRGSHRMGRLAALTVGQAASVLFASLVLVIMYGIAGAVYALFLGASVIAVLAAASAAHSMSAFGISLRGRITRKAVADVTRYAGPVLASGLVTYPTIWIVETFVALRLSVHDLGLYRIGYGFYNLLVTVPAVLAVPLMPLVAELSERSPDRLKETFSRLLRVLLLAILPVSVGIALAARPLLSFLFGDVYADADLLTSVLVLAALFVALAPATGSIFLGSGRAMTVLAIDIVWSILFIPMTFAFVETIGLIGVAVAHLAVRFIILLLTLGFLRKEFGVRIAPFLPPILLSLGGAGLVVGIVFGLPRGIAPLFAGPVAAALALAAYRFLSAEERSLLIASIRDIAKR